MRPASEMAAGRVWMRLVDGRRATTLGQASLEPVHPVRQRCQRRVRFPSGQAHQCDLEDEPRVRRIGAAHVHHCLPEGLERTDQMCVPQRFAHRVQASLLFSSVVE